MPLPPETLELIFVHLPRRDLVAILTASAALHNVAARVLYRMLVDVSPAVRALRLVKTLARSHVYPPLVHRLDLDWSTNLLTANLLRLLHRALLRLTRLTHLGLEFSAADNDAHFAWILQGCTFSLRVFTTSMRCEPLLARFLETQPDVVEICLRGFTFTPPPPPSPSPVRDAPRRLPLAPCALPRLRHFRTVLASSDVTADFIRGRPVETVSLSLYPGASSTASLDALLLSTRPLRRLTVMAFHTASPATLFAEIGTRLPALEALHAVLLLVRQTTHELVETASSLSHFKALRYLTFMAPGTLSSENENEIVTLWGQACPTLRTIILPKGIVWGSIDGRWVSLQDAS